jgi:hypothetical protein
VLGVSPNFRPWLQADIPGYPQAMPSRAQKLIIAVSIAAVMFLGYLLERYYIGWDGAFMTLGGIAVAVGGAYVVMILMNRRRQ